MQVLENPLLCSSTVYADSKLIVMYIEETGSALTIHSDAPCTKPSTPNLHIWHKHRHILIFLDAIQRRSVYVLLSTSQFMTFSLGHEGRARTEVAVTASWHFVNLATHPSSLVNYFTASRCNSCWLGKDCTVFYLRGAVEGGGGRRIRQSANNFACTLP